MIQINGLWSSIDVRTYHRARCGESRTTNVTYKWMGTVVNALMRIQFAFAHERLRAFAALIWFRLTVTHHVLLQAGILTKSLATNRAQKWTFAAVRSLMISEFRLYHECWNCQNEIVNGISTWQSHTMKNLRTFRALCAFEFFLFTRFFGGFPNSRHPMHSMDVPTNVASRRVNILANIAFEAMVLAVFPLLMLIQRMLCGKRNTTNYANDSRFASRRPVHVVRCWFQACRLIGGCTVVIVLRIIQIVIGIHVIWQCFVRSSRTKVFQQVHFDLCARIECHPTVHALINRFAAAIGNLLLD